MYFVCGCLTVSNCLLMSSATTIVRSGSLFWLKRIVMVFMLCSAFLKPWCVEICGILFVMYGNSVFSSVWLSLREMFMPLFGFGIGMMFVSFHMCGMMLLFSDMLYMLVTYLMLTLSGSVEYFFFALFYCLLDLCCGEC